MLSGIVPGSVELMALGLLCVLSVVLIWLDQLGLKLFRVVPSYAFAYGVPMLGSRLGIISGDSDVYSLLRQGMLPGALFLLLLPIDLMSILRLGPRLLLLFFLGMLSVVGVGPALFALYSALGGAFPRATIEVLSALSASWVGGSVNFAALAESLRLQESIVGQVIGIDIVLSGAWMLLLLFASNWKARVDPWLCLRQVSDAQPEVEAFLDTSTAKALDPSPEGRSWNRLYSFFLVAALASVVVSIAWLVAPSLPRPEELSPFVWVILLTSLSGSLLSLTKLRRHGAKKFPSLLCDFLLYMVLATMGARATFQGTSLGVDIFLFALLWLLLHGGLLLLCARILRLPLGYAAVVSQANIGGVASAPIVGAAYARHLAGVGALLGALGYVFGTYAAFLCRMLFRLLS